MDYDVALKVRKNWKLKEVSDFTVKLRGFFLIQAFEEIMQKLLKICLAPLKNN